MLTMLERWLISISIVLISIFSSIAQSKLNIQVTNPTQVDLCIESDYLEIEVRNTTTSVVSGIETQVNFPKGITYVKGSLSGSGVSEKGTLNLSNPVFSLSNIGIAQSRIIRLRMNTSCDISLFLNNGGLAIVKTTTLYSGGSVQKNSNVLNIRQPSLSIQNITNQLKTADLGETYNREITIKNNGFGKLKQITFNRFYNNGQKLIKHNGRNSLKNGLNTLTTLDSNDFKTIGNNDIYFDYNETYIFKDSIEVVGCNNLNATYTSSWGCDSSICKSIQKSANTSISNKQPDLVFTPTSLTSSCLSDSYTHNQQLIIYNKGNDTARSIDLDIFQSYGNGYRSNMISKILDTSFTSKSSLTAASTKIKPYNSTSTNTNGVYACLGTNAIGQVFLNLQDMAPGDSLILNWKTKSCCPTVCNTGTIYNQRWKFKANYKNQCKTQINYNERYGSYGSVQSFRLSKLIPTDIVDGQTKQLEFTVTNGNLFYPSVRSQLIIQLKLPKTITHSLATNDIKFTHPNGSSWSPSNVTQRNDTVFAKFIGTPKVTLPRSELLINIKGNCQNNSTNSSENIAINLMYNPDTTCSSSCNIPLYCTNDNIKVHCKNSCAGGLHFKNFEAKRISYGLPDNNNDGIPDASGALDHTKIKHNRIMYGDTLLTTFSGKVNNAGQITNWSYGKATTSLDYGRYLSAKEATLEIYRNGSLIVSCNQVPYTFTAAGNNKTYTFDISLGSMSSAGCLIHPNIRYTNLDSLALKVKYVVDRSLNNFSVDLQLNNTFYLSSTANPSSWQKYSCDDFSARLSMLGYYFTNYGTNNITKNGCSNFNIAQNFYLSVGRCCSNYAGGNIFPYEYRKWAKLKEIIFKKPQGFDVTNGSFRQYRTRGTGSSTNQFISTINPFSQTPNEVKYRTDSLYEDLGGSILISDDGFQGTFTASLTPNCKASNSTHNFIYGFVFERLGYLGSGLDTVMTTNTKDIVTFTKQDLNITVTDDYVYPEKDTIEWEIRVSNLNTKALAKNVWLGALSNSNRKIVAIKDKSTNKLLADSNEIFMAGDFAGGAYKDYIVYATYNSCSLDSLNLWIGSNCSSYPKSLLSYPCEYKSYKLKYEPINTRLDATILTRYSDINLCENNKFRVQINNTGFPKVFNSYLDIQIQPGMTLEDTAWLFKDGRSDSICIQNFTLVGPSTYRWDFSNRDSLFDRNGLNGVNSKTGWKMILKFGLSTDCNYTSGSSFLLRPGGYLKCGNPVNSPYILSDPINIKGVVKPYFSSISFNINPLVPCNYNDNTYAKFINLGPDTTGQTDQFVLSLPPGLFVDTTYIDSGHNAPKQKPGLDKSSGQNIYSWKIPPNIIPGDSSVFKIKTRLENFDLTCGIKQIYAQAVVKSSALCVSSGTYCDIKVATSSIQKADSVVKETYALKLLNASSIPNGSNERVSLNYTITNTGIDKILSSPLITQVIYDSNKNGTVDSGDIHLTQDTLLSPITSGKKLVRTLNFSIPSSYSCDLLLYLSDSNCVCNSSVEAISTIQLLNAGNDTTICPGEQITMGAKSDSSSTYQWNNASFLNNPKVSNPVLTASNDLAVRQQITMILTTNRGKCSSNDTAIVTVFAGMEINMPDTVSICQNEQIPIGYFVTGGESKLKKTSWFPTDSLSSSKGFYTYAYPSKNTLYTLTVEDLQGCKINDSTMVQVISKPTAIIGLKDTCAGLLFSFENKSDYQNSQPDSIYWDFGVLGSSNFNNPKYFIDSAQQIKAMLYVNNKYGCWDTTSSILNVNPNPQASFSYNEGCAEDTAQFVSRSSISLGRIMNKWVIDNEEFNTDIANKKLPNKDSILVNLKSYSDQGCFDTFAQWVIIYEKPDISLNLSNYCQNEQVEFVPQFGSNTRDSIISYNWNLGDQTSSSKKFLNHQYADTGTYKVDLQVVTSNQCSDTAMAFVRIYSLPESIFSASNSCENDSSWAINNSTINTGNIIKIYWDIDGKGFVPGKDSIRLNTNQTGEQFIAQKVVSDKGCIDSSFGSYSVYFRESIDHLQQGICENETFKFTSLPTQSDSVFKTTWIIQNDTLEGTEISYQFPDSGLYNLNQKIVTNRGCESDSNYFIIIRPEPYTTILLDQPCDDNLVEFKSSTANQVYQWDLSDGTSQTIQEFSHSFLDTGKYAVLLEVLNEFGCSYSTLDSVDIRNIVKPDLFIQDRCENEFGWVYNLTQGNSQPITQAIFEMGDGNEIEELDSFEYQYSTSGTYPLNLRITTLPGCEYTITKNVIIHPLPTADFQFFPETADIFSSDISCTDQSLGADSVFYYISDGANYGTPNFEHIFSDSGAYSIKQWVISPFGCIDSITKNLYISYAYNLYIPNAFTPTNDGLNEGFKPTGLGVKSYQMSIYNRWGEKIFVTTENQTSWDGKDAIPGYYLYHIKAFDFRGNIHYYKGSVYLIK